MFQYFDKQSQILGEHKGQKSYILKLVLQGF